MNKYRIPEETKYVSDEVSEDAIENRADKPSKAMPTQTLQFKNISDWLKHFNDNFFQTIIANLDDVSNEDQIVKALQQKVKLSSSQVSAVLTSLSLYTFQFTGASLPDTSLCRCLAKLLEKHLPETFTANEALSNRVSAVFEINLPVEKE